VVKTRYAREQINGVSQARPARRNQYFALFRYCCDFYFKEGRMKIAVIGIGQSLRGDDAAGLEAVRLWQEQCPQTARRVQVEFSELPVLGLLDLLDGKDAGILVDAVHSEQVPGTLIRVGPEDLASFTPDAVSAHGWGVAETLQLGRSLYPSLVKCRITLIGIVGGQFDLGEGLSPGVRAALTAAVERIEKEVQNLL
jgi:hydrogenase maturation protease